MPRIRDFTATQVASPEASSIVVELPTHETGDLLVVCAGKDDATGGVLSTPSGWYKVNEAVQGASGNNTIRSGLYIKRASSSSETAPTITSTDVDAWTAIAVSIEAGGWFDSGTIADAVDAAGTNNDLTGGTSANPYVASGVTPGHDNALVLYFGHADGGVSPMPFPRSGSLWVHTEDSASDAMVLSYKVQRTAGASGSVDHYATTTGDEMCFHTMAIRDDGSATHVQSYVSGWGTLLDPLKGNGNPIGGSWPAALDIATVGALSTSYDAVASAADSGVSPFENAANITPVASSTLLGGSQKTLGAHMDCSTGFIVGTYRFTTPRDFIDLGKINEPGMVLAFSDFADTYVAWQVGAFQARDVDKDGRSVFVIQTDQTVDTRYGFTAPDGTTDLTDIDKVLLLTCNPRGAMSVAFNQLVLVDAQGLVVSGGSSTYPITFDKFQTFIGLPYPLPLVSGGVARVPIVIGGADAVHVHWDLFTLQWPHIYSYAERYVLVHVDPGVLGITIDARAGDSCRMTNGLINGSSPFRFEIASTASASATYSFVGLSLVNAIITLRPVTTFAGMAATNCPSCEQNGSTINDCKFTDTLLTCDDPSEISDCQFISGGSGHGIEITTPGVYTFSGNQFGGYASSDGSTGNEAIYNNSGGAVTLNIVGGGSTPSIRNGTGASTTVANNVTVTLTGLKNPSEVRVFDAGTTTERSGTGAENVTGGTHAFAVPASTSVDISILSLGYQNMRVLGFSTATDATLPISQVVDRQYLNP